MQSRWVRKGDFFKTIELDETKRANPHSSTHAVEFFNTGQYGVILREMVIIHLVNGATTVTLRGSPMKNELLWKACELNFSNFSKNNPTRNIHLHFNVHMNLFNEKLAELLNTLLYINKIQNFNECPESLLTDIKNIFKTLQVNNRIQFKHLVLDRDFNPAYINPGLKNSKRLIDVMELNLNGKKIINEILDDKNFSAEKKFLDKALKSKSRNPNALMITMIKYLLIKGENPNQEDSVGNTVLKIAIPLGKEVLFPLLCYGANPFYTSVSIHGINPLEFAYSYYPHNYNYLIDICSKAEARLQHSKRITLVSQTVMLNSNNISIHTFLFFSNQTMLISQFKKMQNVTDEEKTSLFLIYNQLFKSTKNPHQTFQESFKPGAGKFVDIIRDKYGKIVGAVTFIVKANCENIYDLIDLSFLQPSIQGLGIMTLFEYRLGFALQGLSHNRRVKILFTAASYAAIRKIEMTLYFPKYQPNGMKEEIKEIFEKLFGIKLAWKDVSNGLYCTVEEEYQISVVKEINKKPTIQEEFFYTELRGNSNGYVPVMITAGDNLLETCQDILSNISVNFYAQYNSFKEHLSKTHMLDDVLTTKKYDEKIIYSSVNSFFYNENTSTNNDQLNTNLESPRNKCNSQIMSSL